ncbi:MAG: hypothetical protein HYV60_25165 [Planctomycetia bacterium]|nr:hypothetical protein [Planctomycetia bacterium]
MSLARLLEKQTNAHVTHELRQLLPWDCDERETIVSARVVRLVEFAGWLVGDVGSFYLPYLEQFIAIVPDIRIVCLKRDREAVVESFSRWSEG